MGPLQTFLLFMVVQGPRGSKEPSLILLRIFRKFHIFEGPLILYQEFSLNVKIHAQFNDFLEIYLKVMVFPTHLTYPGKNWLTQKPLTSPRSHFYIQQYCPMFLARSIQMIHTKNLTYIYVESEEMCSRFNGWLHFDPGIVD